MKKIIGLDLGTTSIGWALVNEAEKEGEKSSIVRLGVRQVSLTVDEKNDFTKGKAITTNAGRRQKRGMRRNLQRYKLRREALRACLEEHGFIGPDSVLCEDGADTTFQTHRLRATAAESEITLEEFARVLLMINKKRGYKSNRKANTEDEGALIDGMDIAKQLSEENITPGQLLYREFKKSGRRPKLSFYPSDLRQEFDRIFDFQSQFHSDILDADMREALHGHGRPAITFRQKHNILTAKNSGKEAYATECEWRAMAVSEPLDIEVVAYVLDKISGAISGSSQLLGMISDRSKELYFSHKTIGQWQYQQLLENRHNSLVSQTFYRQDYLDEFDTIWDKQAEFHPELTPELKKKVGDIIFYQRELKSCKNLVSYCELEHREIEVTTPDGKRKKVTTGSKVCPKSSPLFQDFKVWQRLNDVKVSYNGRRKAKAVDMEPGLFDDVDTKLQLGERFLTQKEKDKLYQELSIKQKLTKVQVLKLLEEDSKEADLNFTQLDGNTTMAEFYASFQEIISQSGRGEYDFAKMKASDVRDTVKRIFAELGFNTEILSFDSQLEGAALEAQPAFRLWHLLYSYAGDKSATGNEALYDKISSLCGFDRVCAMVMAGTRLQPDYGSLSTKAMRRILPSMMQGYPYSEACELAGYNHSVRSRTKEELLSRTYKEQLELLPKNSLRNPVVEKIINQMINVVNALSAAYGKPDEIRIELARELKKNQEERKKMSDAINDNTKENEAIRKTLEKDFGLVQVTKNDILRYRLYEELKDNGYKTLYSNTYISKEKLFSKDFDIEHIIPKARLFDDSFANKTLESRSVNIDKGNATAYDYVEQTYGQTGLEEYVQRVNSLKGKISPVKIGRLLMREADIPDGFVDRDLRDTQYIAKKAREILEQMVPVVTATTGSVTSRLREDWQLVDVMQELNYDKYQALGLTEDYTDKDGRTLHRIKDWSKRNDHRHHAMDALTIAFTKPSIIQYLNHLNARFDKAGAIYGIECKELHRSESSHKLVFNSPMPEGEFRAEARKHLAEVLISIKAKNKVMTRNTNRIKVRGGHIDQVQLTPRGPLSNETIYGMGKDGNCTQRVAVSENLNLSAVIDRTIAQILQQRLDQCNGDKKAAFGNLDENPIWQNEAKGIAIKKVKVRILKQGVPLHAKRDNRGEVMLDKTTGQAAPCDYVQTANNHHIAIYRDEDGNLQERLVTFLEAVTRANNGDPVIDRNYRRQDGWQFQYTMKMNEYFVFPNPKTGFDPQEIDLMDKSNFDRISPNLYRVQKLSSKYYVFRHHLDTTVDEAKELQETTWKRLRSPNALEGIVKVRVNHIGEIVAVGEY